MKILTPASNSQPPAPRTPEIVARIQAGQLKAAPRQIITQLFAQWARNFDLLWSTDGGATPQMRLAALGPLGGELMVASAGLCQFLLTMLGDSDPAMKTAIESRLASVPPFTVAEDGTVTLD